MIPGQQVLVTGASGFIGGALAARLLQDGVRVRALVRSPAKGAAIAAQGAELIVGDLADPRALQQAVDGCEVVFNVGAAVHGSALVQYAVNVRGVENLVHMAHVAGVRRVVHVSSIAVYGYQMAGIISEETKIQPGSEYYGQSKALGERSLFQTGKALKIEVTAIRPGMVYGPRSGFWTGKLFRMMKRPPALLPGDGSTYCPVIFIDDVVDLLILAAEHPAAAGEVFNAVSDATVTWREFLGAYAAMAGHKTFLPVPIPVIRLVAGLVEPYLRLADEPQPLSSMVNVIFAQRRGYSMNKAARLLGWRPRVSLREGMAQAESWLREKGFLE